ncbi:unnamed protein product [Ambrosiozyma monospora]|uniref:Unnamed protein product n=1 Tax=Ambrosiozyma monospora TaxID=43982 RepID=A0A9W6Z4N7_AMBMO|nr:unnamed protein product [Ambrosiozyma monospora]
MRVFFGIWAGGDSSNAVGTIQWAGGDTDYSDAPFTMSIKSLVVADYSSGETYSYSDQSGDYSSIVAKNGEVNGRVDEANEEFDAFVNGETVSSGSSSTKNQGKNVSDINSSSISGSGSGSKTATATSTSTASGSGSASDSASITDSNANSKSTDDSSASKDSTLSTIVTTGSDSSSKDSKSSSTAKSVTESNLGNNLEIANNVPTQFAGFLSLLLVAVSLL